ncbi:chaplin [Embleya sp. AB8]|uniref:chaplin n=1 Tax=Embleya sp. AB8 TaxID=3156304 RepID=UPI003C76DA27
MNKLTKGAVVSAAILGGSVAMGGQAFASAEAGSAATDSPGVVSGNTIQVPVHVPINLCGNSIDVIAVLNPVFGNACVNADGSERAMPEHHAPPVDDDCPPELLPAGDELEGPARMMDPAGPASLAGGLAGGMTG